MTAGNVPKPPKPDFYFSFFFTKTEGYGKPASKRAFIVALVLPVVLGLPVGVGLGWRIATADLSIISAALGKGLPASVRAASRE